MLLRNDYLLKIFFSLALFLNVIVWFHGRHVRAEWGNVPPVPSKAGASIFALGDDQLSYRLTGTMLQNLGNAGGRVMPLEKYNYNDLSAWFFLADKLDPRSDFIPFLASYYFSATQNPQQLSPLIDYLHAVGKNPEGQKWRWLAQAVYLSRFVMNDLDRALALSYDLAAVDNPKMPLWAREMPAFILNAKGSKQEALDLLIESLKSNVDTMQPSEVNSTRDYICTRILDAQEAAVHPLCKDIPWRQ